jgi:CRISPR-associated protein Csb2
VIAIEVSFLTGRYSATAHHDRQEPEWPPHGARLFSAMVAAWADLDPPDDAERAVLEWLESQPPPRITAPEAVRRRVVSHFVPVNDASVIPASQYKRRADDIEELVAQWEDELDAAGGEITKTAGRLQTKINTRRDVDSLVSRAGTTNPNSAAALLPDGRGKKERSFPSVTLVEPVTVGSGGGRGVSSAEASGPPVVVYAWDDTPPDGVATALDELLSRVTRLGHSSSLVSCRSRDDAPDATHLPDGGTEMLRWVRPGQLETLEEEHRRHQAVRPRSLPFRGVRYREFGPNGGDSTKPVDPATAGDWIVFELQPRHRHMPMTRTVELARVLREAVLSHVADPLPEGVSGHLPDGRPTTAPHIAFLALPNVGHEHAGGRIMGLAVSLPFGLDDVARDATLRGIGTWERKTEDRPLQLRMGRDGTAEIKRVQPPFTLVSLRQPVWVRPSRWWSSVTPVALPAHPGNLRSASPAARGKAWARAEEAVAKSCEHVGLPRPVDVRVSLMPHFVGSRPARDFPVFKQGRRGTEGVVRRLVHASVEFAEETRGPLLLGSGRFLGLGLMRPLDHCPQGGARDSEANDD